MPFGLQPVHLLVILIVALIIFGPQRLPEIGRGLGKALTEFRKGAREMTEGFREEVSKSVEEPSWPVSVLPAQSQPAATVTCPNCGVANPTGARFCNNCGTQLPA